VPGPPLLCDGAPMWLHWWWVCLQPRQLHGHVVGMSPADTVWHMRGCLMGITEAKRGVLQSPQAWFVDQAPAF
jgi:hypothetical protein